VVGGRLIAPVGPDGRQELMRYTKTENRLHKQSLGAVSFVPLLSGLQR
jgi:protein-L-isoaspartate(D-aspartate) O-methyltransferase